MSVSKTLRDSALDSAGIPSESDSLRSFRSVCETDDGSHWLEQAIDPMHDRGFRSTGMPDARMGNSVVRTITKRVTLVAPGASTFDALVHFTGDLDNSMMTDGLFRYDVPTPGADSGNFPVEVQGTSFTRYGGVIVAANTPGADLTFTLPQAIVAPFYEGGNPLDNTNAGNSVYPKGGYRVVAGSIEAYNTTPEIYRSGAVTGYQLQNKETRLELAQVQAAGGAPNTACPINLAPRGPQNAAQAVQLPGSVTHEAREGAYLPLPLNVDNPLNYARFGNKVYSGRDDITATTSTFMTRAIAPGSFGTGRFDAAGNWDLPSGCNPCGLYFTGLSAQSTIDIVVRFVIEEFPAVNDLRMLTLANPSPAFDAGALKSYGLIRAELPIMVPVAWNGMGTWLKSAMKVTKKIAPFVKPFMPAIRVAAKAIPGGQMALDVAEKVVKVAKEAQDAKKKERKKKATQGPM